MSARAVTIWLNDDARHRQNLALGAVGLGPSVALEPNAVEPVPSVGLAPIVDHDETVVQPTVEIATTLTALVAGNEARLGHDDDLTALLDAVDIPAVAPAGDNPDVRVRVRLGESNHTGRHLPPYPPL